MKIQLDKIKIKSDIEVKNEEKKNLYMIEKKERSITSN